MTARHIFQNSLQDYGAEFFIKLGFLSLEGIYMLIWDAEMNRWSVILNFHAHQLLPSVEKRDV